MLEVSVAKNRGVFRTLRGGSRAAATSKMERFVIIVKKLREVDNSWDVVHFNKSIHLTHFELIFQLCTP